MTRAALSGGYWQTAAELDFNVTFYVGLPTYYVLFLDYYYDIIHIHNMACYIKT